MNVKSCNFDLFNLHDRKKDKDSHGWILVSGNGLNEKVKNIYLQIVSKRGVSKSQIYHEFSKILKVHKSTAKRYFLKLNKNDSWLPLWFIENILLYWKMYVSDNPKEFSKTKSEIELCFEKLKIGNWQSRPVNAVKNLTEIFCKFVGACIADGHLNRKNGLVLEDYDKFAVEKFSSWIYELFGLKYKPFKAVEKAWRIEIYNKVISRFLQVFFEFPVGNKSSIVKEPKIIKKAQFKYRKAFASGIMTFDGSVSTQAVSIRSRSYNLLSDLKEIFSLDGITLDRKKDRYSDRLNLKLSKKCLDYFETGTLKWIRLSILLDNKINISENDLEKIFPPMSASKISIKDIISLIKELKTTTTCELAKRLNVHRNILYKYIKILKICKIITCVKRTKSRYEILTYCA